MALAWRRLSHGVIAVPMDGLPDAILAPEDQGGSDHQLGRLRSARKLPPPALDEDPVGHISAHRQEGGVARDGARAGHELRRHPVPVFADLRPAALDAAPEPALADGVAVGAQRLHGFGIAVGDRGACLAELIQERLQGIGSVLLHHGLLLSPLPQRDTRPPPRLYPDRAANARSDTSDGRRLAPEGRNDPIIRFVGDWIVAVCRVKKRAVACPRRLLPAGGINRGASGRIGVHPGLTNLSFSSYTLTG